MANALRHRLLQSIAADVAVRERDDAAHDIAAVNLRGDEQRWDHLITNLFRHDEMALFTDRRLDRGVYNALRNAIKDIPLQTRGRRPFAHSHREQLLVIPSSRRLERASGPCLSPRPPGASQRRRRRNGRSPAGV